MQRQFPGATVVCVGTGPSLTANQVEVARSKGFTLFACNDAIRLAPDAALLFACNWQWWDARWDEVKDLPCEKWTSNTAAAHRFDINYIDGRLQPCGYGLSTDPSYIHHGHGSGYQLLEMAKRSGARRIVLLGYDLAFAADYDGRGQQVGSSPRHFFGEYEPALQHWPHVAVHHGVHTELLRFYGAVAEQTHVTGPDEIINCSGGVLNCFPRMDIRET